MNYIPRALEKNILEATKTYPVVMVCGPRQVGKSTMLQHLMEPGRTFVTLRTPEIRLLAKEHPAQFFETYKPPILIDEFQLEPSLLDTIQYLVDEKRRSGENSNGMFWLTGSNKFTMLKGASETLVGRCRVFEMQSLSSSELYMTNVGLFVPDKQGLDERIKNFKPKSQDEIFERIYYGSMPQICASSEYSRKDYYSEYRNLYLMRDVLEITEIEKVPDFFQFLSYMAACTSQELNYATISNALKIKTETVKKWVSLLEILGTIVVIRPYYSNPKIELVKNPKFYFMDTGFVSFMCNINNVNDIKNSDMAGALFETYVVSEILKSYYNTATPLDIHFYRDKNQKEVDLLITKSEKKLYPVEIKMNPNPTDATKNLYVLNDYNLDVQPATIICPCDKIEKYSEKAWLYPVYAL